MEYKCGPWCLRALTPAIQNRIFLFAAESPLARAIKRYYWQYHHHRWSIVPLCPEEDYLIIAYHASLRGRQYWGRAFCHTEMMIKPPVAMEQSGDSSDEDSLTEESGEEESSDEESGEEESSDEESGEED